MNAAAVLPFLLELLFFGCFMNFCFIYHTWNVPVFFHLSYLEVLQCFCTCLFSGAGFHVLVFIESRVLFQHVTLLLSCETGTFLQDASSTGRACLTACLLGSVRRVFVSVSCVKWRKWWRVGG